MEVSVGDCVGSWCMGDGMEGAVEVCMGMRPSSAPWSCADLKGAAAGFQISYFCVP